MQGDPYEEPVAIQWCSRLYPWLVNSCSVIASSNSHDRVITNILDSPNTLALNIIETTICVIFRIGDLHSCFGVSNCLLTHYNLNLPTVKPGVGHASSVDQPFFTGSSYLAIMKHRNRCQPSIVALYQPV